MDKRIISKEILSDAIRFIKTINTMKHNIRAANIDYNNFESVLKAKAEALLKSDNGNTASIQYAISEGDNIAISDSVGLADKYKSEKANKNSIYGIGSISKLYTTAAVLQLVDEGKVDLDLPVINYIDNFKMKDNRYKRITVRMLLNHSAGFMGTTQGNVSFRKINDSYGYDLFLSDLSEQNLKGNPGEYSVYCNDGFTLAQVLVEKVSGMDFSQYIKKNITDPLGLINTKTPVDKFDRSKIAKAYDKYMGREEPVESFMDVGMGGMYSTAEETCKFIRSITNNNSNILRKKSIEAMGKKEYLKGVWPIDAEDNIWSFGLGWDCVNLFPFNRYKIKAMSKAGETLDYNSYVVSIPEYDITMVVISSGGNFENNQYFVVSSLLEFIQIKGIIKEPLPKAKLDYQRSQFMPQYLKDYTGLYVGKNKYYNVNISSDGILSCNMYGYNMSFYHTYSGFFETEDGTMGIRFRKEKNGETYMERRIYIGGYGLYEFAYCEYIGQKVEKNILREDIKKCWDKRGDKMYVIVSENYASEFYQYGLGLWFEKNVNGYINGSNKIVDKSNSKVILKLPIVEGSDVYDCNFIEKNGIEYVKNGGVVYMSQDGIEILNGNINKVNIESDGYTKWFIVPNELNGKILEVNLLDKTNCIIYNSNGYNTDNFYFYKKKSVVLAAEDYVAIVGEKGMEVKLEVKESL